MHCSSCAVSPLQIALARCRDPVVDGPSLSFDADTVWTIVMRSIVGNGQAIESVMEVMEFSGLESRLTKTDDEGKKGVSPFDRLVDANADLQLARLSEGYDE